MTPAGDRLVIRKVDLSKDRARALAYKYAVLDSQDQLHYVFVGDVAKLFRREHVALVRAVRKLKNDWLRGNKHPDYFTALDDVLAWLAGRKGRP